MIRISHIINPVKVNQNSDLFLAQPITFQSMINAKNFLKENELIELCTTQYEEDKEIIPKDFVVLPNLKQSVLDINQKLTNRKLPLIKDILDTLHAHSQADYYIYTNVDIGLMPNFYARVLSYIEKGYDAIIINRRRISIEHFKNNETLEKIYNDKGKSHPGFDCFVFHRRLLEKFILDKICVGIPFLGVSLAYNIFSFAKKPLYVPNQHLTFHIGMDVLPKRNNKFYVHNFNSFFYKIKPQLKKHFKLENFPYSDKFFLVALLKWMLNPSLGTRDFLEIKFPNIFKESKSKPKVRYTTEDKIYKQKSFLNEIRWWILQR